MQCKFEKYADVLGNTQCRNNTRQVYSRCNHVPFSLGRTHAMKLLKANKQAVVTNSHILLLVPAGRLIYKGRVQHCTKWLSMHFKQVGEGVNGISLSTSRVEVVHLRICQEDTPIFH